MTAAATCSARSRPTSPAAAPPADPRRGAAVEHDLLTLGRARQQASVTDPRGLVTSYVHDGLDNLLQQSSPDTGVTTYQVDAASNRTQQTDAAGNVVQLSWDPLNRLTAKTYPNDPTATVTYTYDQPSLKLNTSNREPIDREG